MASEESGNPVPGRPVRGSRTGRPIMATLDLLGRRGALRVLWELREERVLTFRALERATGLPPGTLNARIRELREAGVVSPEQGYRLSPLGLALFEALRPLHDWSLLWAETRGGPA